MKDIDSNQETAVRKNEAFEKIIEDKGGNKTAIGRKLGEVSGQLIGQYIQGRQKPKEDFFQKWKAAYGEDIRWAFFETNVSNANNTKPLQGVDVTQEGSQQLMQIVVNLTYIGKKNADSMDRMTISVDKMADSNLEISKSLATLVNMIASNSDLAALLKPSQSGPGKPHDADDLPIESFLGKEGSDFLKKQQQAGKKKAGSK